MRLEPEIYPVKPGVPHVGGVVVVTGPENVPASTVPELQKLLTNTAGYKQITKTLNESGIVQHTGCQPKPLIGFRFINKDGRTDFTVCFTCNELAIYDKLGSYVNTLDISSKRSDFVLIAQELYPVDGKINKLKRGGAPAKESK